jgi:hypothetical protein
MTVTTNICKAISARDSLSSLFPPTLPLPPSSLSRFHFPSSTLPRLPSSHFILPNPATPLPFSLFPHQSSSSTSLSFLFPLHSFLYTLFRHTLSPYSLFPLSYPYLSLLPFLTFSFSLLRSSFFDLLFYFFPLLSSFFPSPLFLLLSPLTFTSS